MSRRVSVIVPTLNEAAGIVAALESLAPLRAAGHEVIVVDGGSADGTARIARPHADVVLTAARGRATQMNAGAEIATGDVLLFLHADTRLPAGAADTIVAAVAGPASEPVANRATDASVNPPSNAAESPAAEPDGRRCDRTAGRRSPRAVGTLRRPHRRPPPRPAPRRRADELSFPRHGHRHRRPGHVGHPRAVRRGRRIPRPAADGGRRAVAAAEVDRGPARVPRVPRGDVRTPLGSAGAVAHDRHNVAAALRLLARRRPGRARPTLHAGIGERDDAAHRSCRCGSRFRCGHPDVHRCASGCTRRVVARRDRGRRRLGRHHGADPADLPQGAGAWPRQDPACRSDRRRCRRGALRPAGRARPRRRGRRPCGRHRRGRRALVRRYRRHGVGARTHADAPGADALGRAQRRHAAPPARRRPRRADARGAALGPRPGTAGAAHRQRLPRTRRGAARRRRRGAARPRRGVRPGGGRRLRAGRAGARRRRVHRNRVEQRRGHGRHPRASRRGGRVVARIAGAVGCRPARGPRAARGARFVVRVVRAAPARLPPPTPGAPSPGRRCWSRWRRWRR